MSRSVLQDWVITIPFMQQSVLLTAIRGADGLKKKHPAKYLQRWFRRCVLITAFDGKTYDHPGQQGGGSFTGPVHYCFQTHHVPFKPDQVSLQAEWENGMNQAFEDYLECIDEVPHHFQLHFLHAAEIIGYQHPNLRIRKWWNSIYLRLVKDMHLKPEPFEEMNRRLSDNYESWKSYCDESEKD